MVAINIILIIVQTIVFSLIFWIITFLLKYLYSNKKQKNKYIYYECGFNSVTVKQVKYKINYILFLLYIIIYEGEFLVLIPFSMNSTIFSITAINILIFFTIWLVITLVLDLNYGALEWHS